MVVDRQLVDRNAHLGSVAENGDVFGAEFEQRLEGGAGPALGPGLEVAASQDEHGHAGGDLEVHLRTSRTTFCGPGEPVLHADLASSAEEQGVQRPADRRRHADGDQRVHRRGGMLEVDPGRPVERPRPPCHHGGGEGEREPLPTVELERRNHRQHDHRNGERKRGEQAGPERRKLIDVTVVSRLGGSPLCWAGECRGVAGGLHGADQLVDRHPLRGVNRGLLGRVVDRGGHTVELVELLLDAHGA